MGRLPEATAESEALAYLTRDAATVRAQRERRRRRLYLSVVPRMRLLGMTALVALCAVHELAVRGVGWTPELSVLAAAALVYSLVTPLFLRLTYDFDRTARWSDVLLCADLAFASAAIAVTGGSASWLFVVPYGRIGDHLMRGFRRCCEMLVLASAAHFVGVWGPARLGDTDVDWSIEGVKFAGVVVVWVHVMVTARVAEGVRDRGRATARLARKLLGELDERSKELEAAAERAQAATVAKGEFLAKMSHELRTPMNGILGMTELALASGMSDEQADLVETAQRSARSLLGMVDDILDYSKLGAGRMTVDPRPFSVRDGVSDVVRTIEPLAREKGIRVVVDVDDALPDLVVGDETRIRQVLMNLCGNAVKFTSEGSVTVDVRGLDVGPGSGVGAVPRIRFRVVDSGIGIAEDRLEHVFEAFTQAERSTARCFGGTGLGLAISRELCSLMGGTLVARSRVGAGSTFEFELPLPAAEGLATPSRRSDGEGGRAARARRERRTAKPLRILVMEDNPVNQRVARLLLGSWGHSVLLAENGEVGLETLDEASSEGAAIDAALVDVQMPVLNGLDAVREWRRREATRGLARLPVAAMTAIARESDRASCLEAGMDAFVAKPFEPDELFELIEKIGRGDSVERRAS